MYHERKNKATVKWSPTAQNSSQYVALTDPFYNTLQLHTFISKYYHLQITAEERLNYY